MTMVFCGGESVRALRYRVQAGTRLSIHLRAMINVQTSCKSSKRARRADERLETKCSPEDRSTVRRALSAINAWHDAGVISVLDGSPRCRNRVDGDDGNGCG